MDRSKNTQKDTLTEQQETQKAISCGNHHRFKKGNAVRSDVAC